MFLQDLRFALRILSGSPGFAAVAVLTLALGIASSTTVFSWMDGLLWHPFLGTARSGELAVMEMADPGAPNGGTSVSWLDYTDYRNRLHSVTGLALHRYGSLTLGDSDSARPAWGELVSADYFEVLGVRPLMGSLFRSGGQSDTPGAYPVTVLSERLWRSSFRGDPSVIGKPIRVNRHDLIVVGIAPAAFHGTATAMLQDIWVPASMGAELGLVGETMFKDRGYRDFTNLIVRLKPGVSMERAQKEAAALAGNLASAYPTTNRRRTLRLVRPWNAHTGTEELLASPLRILMAVSLVLLLIVCANVANLLLSRSVIRTREFGIRLTLGASRRRIASQVMTETLLIALLGAFAALLILPWMWSALLGLLPDVGLPVVRDFELHGSIAAFAALCCVLSALAAGSAPALLSARANLNEVLKEGGRGGMSGGSSHGARNLLVVAEVALAAVALISAGLFARSFQNAREIHPGFDSRNVLFARMFLDGSGYTADQQAQFVLRLRRSLETGSGVERASYGDFTPLSTTAGPYDRVGPQGYVPAQGESLDVNRAAVAPGYFQVMRIPLLAGRDFNDADDVKAASVLIVNQEFSRRYFHSEQPVGRKVRLFGKLATVVGMARDSKYFNPMEPARPFFYLPLRQLADRRLSELDVFVRVAGEPEQAVPLLRRAVTAADPVFASYHAVALSEYTQIALFPQKLAASLLGWLGVTCLFLAALGLYSVISCAVNQRAQEIGVRMAMGALPRNVIGMVVWQGMSLVLVGLAFGIPLALLATRVAAGMLVRVGASDPMVFGAAGLFLAFIALIATWLPARRATRVDPMIALRQQ